MNAPGNVARAILAVIAALLLPGDWGIVRAGSDAKEATGMTNNINAGDSKRLPFNDERDFEEVRRGFIATMPTGIIRDANGRPVWDMEQYSFISRDAKAPDTVNPSLWRQEQLNTLNHGLFKVVDRIYQVRGYDLSNVSFILGETGYIVIDPLISAETAKAALELVYEKLGWKPIKAVIYTHSHVDHFGGVKGIVSEEDVKSGKIKVVAPIGFMEAAVSENVTAGNAMSRRATYMYGSLLPKGPQGQVGAGLGKTTSSGTVTLIAPTDTIAQTGQEMTIDGVKIVFQNTPGAEAPAEMCFYFPQFRALCMAEITSCNMHNVLTLRGAQVRDAKIWGHHIQEAMDLFGDKTDVVFTSHHWPRWGKVRITDYLKKQRDLYKYIHDQTLRLINHGYTPIEIAEMLELPRSLDSEWFNHGYYGTLNHNVKAVYQKYIGWFDGNPANLHPLPPEEAGRKYVELAGGPAALLEKAREAYRKGEYRWVAQVVSHLVFADPKNREAREIEADALEQLGYRAESGVWRNFYLTGAMELRKGVVEAASPKTAGSDLVKALTPDMIFDYLAVRLNGPKAAGKTIVLKINFTDTKKTYVLTLENSVLHHYAGERPEKPDTVISLSRAALGGILSGQFTLADQAASGQIKIEGDGKKMGELFSLMDNFPFWFNIVTP